MTSWKENGKLKLMIIVGTRPEIIRLSAVIKKCRKSFDTILAHTGQNYDYTLKFIHFSFSPILFHLSAVPADPLSSNLIMSVFRYNRHILLPIQIRQMLFIVQVHNMYPAYPDQKPHSPTSPLPYPHHLHW